MKIKSEFTIRPDHLTKIECLLNSDPRGINFGTNLYFLRFCDNPTVYDNWYDRAYYISCFWNDKGNTYQDFLRIPTDKIDDYLKYMHK